MNTIKFTFATCLLLLATTLLQAQVGVGTSTPAASAKLEISSTTQGFLPPRMTTAQRDAISSPADGLVIFNLTTNSLETRNSTGWVSLSETSIGSISNTSNAKGASISSGVLSLTPADGTNGGIVTNGTQTFAGAKTFNSDLVVNGLRVGRGGDGTWANNTTFGYNALNATLTGRYNTAIGYNALQLNNSGNQNAAIGAGALAQSTEGSYNTAIGDDALYSNTGGINNTAIGNDALYSNTGNAFFYTGCYNTAIGGEALYSNTNGYGNTAIGYQAGKFFDDGTPNDQSNSSVYLGSYTKAAIPDPALPNNTNEIVIGHGASGNGSNTITLGNSFISSIRCQVQSITGLSDRRDKAEITSISEGIDFVKKLNPVTFTWNTRDKAKVGIKSAGFIAQELLALQKGSRIGDNLDLVSEKNPEKLEARYGNLLPVIVKAIQELSDQKDQEIKELKERLDKLEKLLLRLMENKK